MSPQVYTQGPHKFTHNVLYGPHKLVYIWMDKYEDS